MNQGRLLLAALAQFRKNFDKDGSAIFRWLGAGMRNVRTTLSLDELLQLGFTATQVPAKRVTNLVLIGTTGIENGASVVYLTTARNQPLLQDIAADGFILPKDIPEDAQPAN